MDLLAEVEAELLSVFTAVIVMVDIIPLCLYALVFRSDGIENDNLSSVAFESSH
jgi:hypothetical protein